ncbi:MAG TPA: site-2 protease family protein [Candidatus Latescibacteria bacterium]|nr:site-2 protease family protein [Candidatus Latescibacterota bacterium]
MSFLVQLLLAAPPILFALSIHEYAHGLVADRFGDPTARLMGRLTLNPLAHLDPLGTLMIFLVHFGWAKPVPVDPYNLRDPKRDMIWISLAGPTANILAAALCGVVFRILLFWGLEVPVLLWMLRFGVFINLILAFFNLIPIPPLDGSKILMGLLPADKEYKFRQLERYGPMILVGVILLGYWSRVPVVAFLISPFVNFFSQLFIGYKYF